MIESSFPKRRMGREHWKFLAFLICCLNVAAVALSHGVGTRSKRWGHSSCRCKLGTAMDCKRDHCGDGRGAALAGPQHQQRAKPHVDRHHEEQLGSSYVVPPPPQWLPSSGLSTMGLVPGAGKGKHRQERKRAKRRIGWQLFFQGMLSGELRGPPGFGSVLHP